MTLKKITVTATTEKYFLVEITFKRSWYSKTITRKCFKEKQSQIIYYFDSGDPIPFKLWSSVNAFIELHLAEGKPRIVFNELEGLAGLGLERMNEIMKMKRHRPVYKLPEELRRKYY